MKKIFASPVLWGGIFSVAFYFPIHQGWISDPFIQRYFASHPILYAITVMFFVGLASLMAKYLAVLAERSVLRQTPILDPRSPQKVDVRYTDHYLATIQRHIKKFGESILSRRLQLALLFVKRGGSAEELDTELRYLSEDDATKADADYGLVRLVLWAVPMVGFLGTVVGITMALGNLDLNAINESSKMLSAGLAVAFDTTALAIALDLVLYFIQFVVYREESNLLREVDRLTGNELRGRFEMEVGGADNGQVVAVRRMLETVVTSLEQLTTKQSQIWEQTLTANAEVLKKSLAAAINESMSQHAQTLAQAEERFLDTLRQLQNGSVQQTEAIQKVLGTGSQLVQLEENLHRNLAVLAKVGNFEETVNSLAAAIHLLNARRAA